MWHDLWVALCLVFVIEGMFPFLNPGQWRDTVSRVARLNDRQIRMLGFVSMLIGVVCLYWVNRGS
jgi:hypothetical protein